MCHKVQVCLPWFTRLLHTVGLDRLQKAASPHSHTHTHSWGGGFTCSIVITGPDHRDPILQNAPTKHFIKEDDRW